MSRMDEILENVSIDAWARAFSRDARQVNAELLGLIVAANTRVNG